MAGTTAANPAAQKAQQQAALDRIIRRLILSNAATDQGLDKEPNFAILSERAKQTLLIQLMESKVAASVPVPSNEEVTQFIQTNPNIFAERKLLDVDQIRTLRPRDPKIVKGMKPLKTLDEIAAYLTQNQIPFQRGTNVMDMVGQDPKLVNAVMALPPHEVFIVSSGNEIIDKSDSRQPRSTVHRTGCRAICELITAAPAHPGGRYQKGGAVGHGREESLLWSTRNSAARPVRLPPRRAL